MKLMTFQRGLLGLLVALFLSASSLRAEDALVDNFNGGTNENQFEHYWFYYDDNGGTKDDDRPIAGEGTQQSTIDVPYALVNREASDNKADTFKIRKYSFLVKQEGDNKYGCMPFTYGEKWKASYGMTACYVGVGTQLAPDKKFINLTGATAVSFKLRAHVNDLSVTFKVETMDITRDSSFAFFCNTQAVPKGVWTPITVSLTDTMLQQPGWASAAQLKAALDIAEVTKIAWEVHGDNNTTVTSDTLDIDDVVILGYKFVSPSLWTKTASARPATGLFATFEEPEAEKAQTPLHTYWYAYDDHEIQGNSTVTLGAEKDTASQLLNLNWQPNSGYGNAGTGAVLQMKLGKTLKQANGPGDTANVQGFVGIGFNVYDSAGALYFNTTNGKLGNTGGEGNTNSLYFEYIADGDFKYLTLEISDMWDVPDKTNPTRKDTRGKGIVWYRNFPKTGPNEWRRVEIPFDSLVIHSNWVGFVDKPLDKTQLAKIQFKVQGAQDQQGIIQIDNIYFPGIDFGKSQGVKNSAASSGQLSAFKAFYSNGIIRVNWKPVIGLNTAKISLIDSKGTIAKSATITQVPNSPLAISAENLPAGLYFVQLNGTNAAGKEIAQRSAVTVLK